MRWLTKRVRFWALFLAVMSSAGVMTHASTPDCESRLGAGFATVVEKALAQGLLTPAQVERLASAPRPFNPLANMTPGSKNLAFIRLLSLHMQMSDEAWVKERAKLRILLDGTSERAEMVNAASESTRNIFSPRLLKTLKPSSLVQWIEHAGHAYLVAEVDGYVELSELGKDGYIWRSTEPFDTSLTHVWFNKSDGACYLNYYREVEMQGLDRLRHLMKIRFDKTLIDLPSLTESRGTLYVNDQSVIGNLAAKEKYSVPRASANASRIEPRTGPSYNRISASNVADEPFTFIPQIPEELFPTATAYKTSDGRILVAAATIGPGVRVFEPLKSEHPIFSYNFPSPPNGMGKEQPHRFQFFEKSGQIYLYSEFNGRPGGIDFFELGSGGPLYSLAGENWGAFMNEVVLKGADGQVFLIRRNHTTEIYSLFGSTGDKP